MNTDVIFKSGDFKLAGTLSVPDSSDSFPGVLLIPGSGQIDRDENHRNLRLNVFHDLAGLLTSRGYAVLRYDKRGVGKSSGDYWSTGFYDNASDALHGLEFLKKQTSINPRKVFLLGHSEGAFLSTYLAANNGDMAGIILLAGGVKSGEEILKWQARKIAGGLKGFNKWLINVLHIDVLKSQKKQLDRIKKSDKDYYRVQLFAKINAKWMREFIAYNPADYLPQITVPVLAITGSKDIQVDPDDLLAMKELVTSPFEYHILQDVSHLLRPEPEDASISHYKKMVQQPLDNRIPDLILDWLDAQTKD